jgi:hypothetical protein
LGQVALDEFGEDMGDITPEDNPLGYQLLDSIRDAVFEDLGVPACDNMNFDSFERRNSYLELAQEEHWSTFLRRPAKKVSAALPESTDPAEPFEQQEPVEDKTGETKIIPSEHSVGFDKGPELLDYEMEENAEVDESELQGKNPEVSEDAATTRSHGESPLDQRPVKASRSNPMNKPELDNDESERLKMELKKRSDSTPLLPDNVKTIEMTSPSYSVSGDEPHVEPEGIDISTSENPRVSYFDLFLSLLL